MSNFRGESAEWNFAIPTRHAVAGGATGALDIRIANGLDWSGAVFVMTFRPAEGQGGAATITLTAAAAGSQGLSATYDAAMVHPSTGAVIGGTVVVPQIDETTLEALSWGSTPTDEPLVLHYDLLATPSGAPQRQLLFGTATIYPGVGD